MQNYITLVRLRESSSSAVNPSQIVRDVVESNKGQLVSAHATLGFYDLVIVASYPDQKSAFSASTALKTRQNWITETMAAEPLVDFDKILSEAQRGAATTSRR